MWLLDSGVSKHMTFRSDWIRDLQRYSDEHVLLGDGTTCKVHGRETVYIKRLVNNQWLEGRLENVFYVPDLNKNFFSVGACMKKNYRVIFKDESLKLFLDNELMVQGIQCDNNLFNMLFKVQLTDDACPVTTTSVRRWHDRLGHVSYKYIRQMNKDGLIGDSTTEDVEQAEDLFCETCR